MFFFRFVLKQANERKFSFCKSVFVVCRYRCCSCHYLNYGFRSEHLLSMLFGRWWEHHHHWLLTKQQQFQWIMDLNIKQLKKNLFTNCCSVVNCGLLIMRMMMMGCSFFSLSLSRLINRPDKQTRREICFQKCRKLWNPERKKNFLVKIFLLRELSIWLVNRILLIFLDVYV